MNTNQEYLKLAANQMRQYKELADKTFAQLNTEDWDRRFSPDSNSIAIIIKHMAGNMKSRFTNFLTEDGEKTWRRRDEEFVSKGESPAQIRELWEDGWQVVFDALESLKPEDLNSEVSIRQEKMTALNAINRQLAHYSYHVGQIVLLGRLMKGDKWNYLSIPPGKSEEFNVGMQGLHEPKA